MAKTAWKRAKRGNPSLGLVISLVRLAVTCNDLDFANELLEHLPAELAHSEVLNSYRDWAKRGDENPFPEFQFL